MARNWFSSLAPLSALFAIIAGGSFLPAHAADEPLTVRVDFATYNPVSLILKDQHILENKLGPTVKVEWIQSIGSNKALEYLNARSLDFGSTAGGAALLGRVNGNPIKTIYVASKPEWAAIVVPNQSPITTVQQLSGKRIAVTRGTDPHIFLLRALKSAGLSEKDIRLIPLQHGDGRLALDRGDVDAWSGLDPFIAQAELESHDRLLYRNPEFNSYDVVNVREAFSVEHPEIVEKLIAAYEEARHYALDHPETLQKTLAAAAKLPADVVARQLERTDLKHPSLDQAVYDSIRAAGAALQTSALIPPEVKIDETVAGLIDPRFTQKLVP